MDVHDDKEKNIVTTTFELPGLKKEDVTIDVHNNVLTVSGEAKHDEERDENGYAIRERRFGKFSRAVPLPQGIKVRVFYISYLTLLLLAWTDSSNVYVD
jgi:HSP20 family protein